MLPLAVVEPPLKLSPYEVALIWHERCHRDREHGSWLRREITAAARTAASGLTEASMANRLDPAWRGPDGGRRGGDDRGLHHQALRVSLLMRGVLSIPDQYSPEVPFESSPA